MISAGALTERVDIMTPEISRGSMNEQVIQYRKAITVWANVQFQRGARALTAGEAWMNSSAVVTMRYMSVVTDRCRLVWDGKTYRIDSCNRSKRDGSITITASVLDEGSGFG